MFIPVHIIRREDSDSEKHESETDSDSQNTAIFNSTAVSTRSKTKSKINQPFPLTLQYGSTILVQAYAKGGGVYGPLSSSMTPLDAPALLLQNRWAGGGSRSQIFGTSVYGSGYPHNHGRGVAWRGLPFYFWPVVWPTPFDPVAQGKNADYLYRTKEYGQPNDNFRPGSILTSATFTLHNSSSVTDNTFRVVADQATVYSLIGNVYNECSKYLDPSSATQRPVPFDMGLPNVPIPTPNQAVQYYRASSIVLVLDSYNNEAAFAPEHTPNTPLPVWTNTEFMSCLNSTIGAAAPIFNQKATYLWWGPFLAIPGGLLLLVAIFLGWKYRPCRKG